MKKTLLKTILFLCAVIAALCLALFLTGHIAGWDALGKFLLLSGVALFLFFFAAVIFLMERWSEACRSAYEYAFNIETHPNSEGPGGRLVIEIENLGPGTISICSTGFIDTGSTHMKANFLRQTPSTRLPVKLAPKEKTILEMNVDASVFQGAFQGFFFDIDALESEQTNKHSKFLAKCDLAFNRTVPKHVARQFVYDDRLSEIFLNNSKGDTYRKINKFALWLSAIMVLAFFAWTIFLK